MAYFCFAWTDSNPVASTKTPRWHFCRLGVFTVVRGLNHSRRNVWKCDTLFSAVGSRERKRSYRASHKSLDVPHAHRGEDNPVASTKTPRWHFCRLGVFAVVRGLNHSRRNVWKCDTLFSAVGSRERKRSYRASHKSLDVPHAHRGEDNPVASTKSTAETSLCGVFVCAAV